MEEYNNVQRLAAKRNEIYWIVYQTVNLENNKIYIGVHKTKTPYEFDGYLGCGVYVNLPASYIYGKTKFENAVKKYGPKSFRRTVLKIFDNEEDAYLEEGRLVNEKFLSRPDVYNMILGGKLPPYIHPIKAIYQYSLTGTFIKEFDSIESAAKEINRDSSSLSEAISFNFSCAGYYWSDVKNDKLDISNYHSTKNCKTIYRYSIEGEYIDSFESTRATGYSQASQSAILGNLVDGKYYFCYIKSDSYSKARDIYIKSRVIYQYDENGNFLKGWNYLDAMKTFKGDNLNQAIRHKKLTKSGYWGLQKYDVYNKPIQISKKKIGKYTLDGKLIKIYQNSSECYKENGKSVYKNLVGIRNSYKGYKYQYIE